MDPDRSLSGEVWEKAHPFSQPLSKIPLDKASQEEIGNQEDEQNGEKEIVEVVGHRIIKGVLRVKIMICPFG